ncbi:MULTISPECIES: hypothetical protein [Dickeya]|uniref:Uncharacterized protein n=1 Tax=Dickeya solani TaxID=1089444 RepID=A0AAX4F387_9GAMM|nr:hypothetical protein [Dickeya solani]WOA54160.1 hypothetical protein RXA29_08045 [Dickeya solani]
MKAIITATGFIKPYAGFTGGITSDTALIAGDTGGKAKPAKIQKEDVNKPLGDRRKDFPGVKNCAEASDFAG